MTKPAINVALPWFADAARDAVERQAWPRLPAFAWLSARGGWSTQGSRSWRHWLLAKAGVPDPADVLERYAAGPCLALLVAAPSDGVAAWACAQPAHLAAALDHLRFATAVLNLSADAESELLQMLNRHFADRGLGFERGIAGGWLLRSAAPVDCVTHDPAAAAGRNVHDFMPAGPDGALVRGIMNEVQMLLHEHPVNAQRQRRGELALNAVWPWGFGTPLRDGTVSRCNADAMALQAAVLHTDDVWMSGLWQAHHATARHWSAQPSIPGSREPMFVAVTRPGSPDTASALATIDNDLLAPLQQGVAKGRYGELELLLGSRILRVTSSARFAFWRRPAAGTQWLQG